MLWMKKLRLRGEVICPRSSSKCGRARFQTDVQFQGPLLSITMMLSSQDGTLGSGSGNWVDGGAIN